VNKLLTLFDKF